MKHVISNQFVLSQVPPWTSASAILVAMASRDWSSTPARSGQRSSCLPRRACSTTAGYKSAFG